ncbi:MAG: hypothetical protein NVS1B10_01130 [Candidatus Saccharimonadales bacterium]
MILGRQPRLGIAELESLYGADKITAVNNTAAIVDVDPCLMAFDRLGGSVKFCKILTILDTSDWKSIEKFLLEVSPGHSSNMQAGKMQLGLSLYGFHETIQNIQATALRLKKVIRKTDRSVRIIPNKTPQLNSAQIIHNHLTGPLGWELVFIRQNDQKTIIGQTIKVQDIESYTARDRMRPKRDAKVGMLPPKLAQIIINLASGVVPASQLSSICDIPAGQAIPSPKLNQTLLDPFTGSGVIMQESLLIGYDVYGTDIDARMVKYSTENVSWLNSKYPIKDKTSVFEQADATTYIWPKSFDVIASEVYLGRPFTSSPSPEVLNQTISDCNLIIKKFLRNIHPQLPPNSRLCLAVPAWQTSNRQFKHLPLIDQLPELGYNRVIFEHAKDSDLIYFRDDQYVARQLLVITRK